MSGRFTVTARAGLILLVLTLLVSIFTPVYAFTNGQNADGVLGQSDFTSSTQ